MQSLREVFQSTLFVNWIGVCAEIAVAVVIYWELNRSRRDAFSEHYRTKYWARGDVYKTFLDIQAADLQQRRQIFCDSVLMTREDIRNKCDEQIDQLNVLWYHAKGWGAKKRLVEWFPHMVVKLWVIAGPYVEKRAERNGGLWSDRHFIDFAKACVKIIRKRECPLRISSGEQVVWIDVIFLRQLETELVSLQ